MKKLMVGLTMIAMTIGMILGCCGGDEPPKYETIDNGFPIPRIEYNPKTYVCYRIDMPMTIDGKFDETAWKKAIPTDYFVDIEGDLKPAPYLKTRVRMLWDDEYFYVAAEMDEPHVWATLTERDAVIYHDNDFEVFIDPDGDTHDYYELEVNAFNTQWDLLLVKPYRDGGPAVNAWDIGGLRTAVSVDGTLNNPGDTDTGWRLEIAIPWSVLKECANKAAPPEDGDQWRVNFSRVEWETEIKDGRYIKSVDAEGKTAPEHNWVWSPQGLIAMHYPEMWGVVQFSTGMAEKGTAEFVHHPEDAATWALRTVYYRQRMYHQQFGTFTDSVSALHLDVGRSGDYSWPPEIEATSQTFEASVIMKGSGRKITIYQDGSLAIGDK